MFHKTKTFKLLLITVILIITLTIIFLAVKLIKKSNAEKNIQSKTIFSIDKIVLYSSASAIKNNNTYQKAYWDLDIYQFTDIAIYLNNKVSSNELSQENTVKTLFIDNINFTQIPQNGTPSLYYKKYSDFGLDKFSKENIINNDVEFQIYSNGENNYDSPAFYTDCSNPITLTYVNNNIVTNFLLLDNEKPITYNGTLLKRANIPLSSISANISFNVNVVNNLNETFTTNIIIPINLKNNTSSIYDGSITETQNTNFVLEKI